VKRLRWLVAGSLILASTVLAGTSPAPSVLDPLPFDHSVHTRALDKAGLTCVSCHPVGLQLAEGAPDSTGVPLPPPPASSCHGCHGGEVKHAGRNAPPDCFLCHADRAELRPVDHGPDWTALHGRASRAAGQSCSNCHSAGACLDCHDRRGAGSANPHGPGFARFHGVEAQVDPRSCSACHAETSCVACHTSGGTPW
jgi:hypothetical protein